MQFRQTAATLESQAMPLRTGMVTAILVALVAGCAAKRPKLPEPLRAPTASVEGVQPSFDGSTPETAAQTNPGGNIVLTPPPVPVEDPGLTAAIRIPPIPNGGKQASMVLDGVPLSAFIDVVFATELKFPISIDRSVRERADMVSLRIADPQPPETIYRLAAEVLRNYGVVVSESGGMLRFYSPSANLGASNIVVARSAPNIPASGRQTFVVVPLDVRPSNYVANQLRTMFPNGLQVSELADASALMLSGPADVVREAALAAVELDKTGFREKGSVRIEPQFLSAEVLDKALREVLTAQGYSVRGATMLQPGVLQFVTLPSSNTLLVFSESRQALEAVAYWAEALDKPSSADGVGGAYVYAPRHTTVGSLLPVLSALVMGSAPTATGGVSASSGGGAQAGASNPMTGEGGAAAQSRPSQQANGASVVSGPNGQIVADSVRNLLVFQGDAQRWRAIQSVLARLDVPTRQVVIEVTVAEVTLTDEFANGIEWAIRNLDIGGFAGPVKILPGAAASAATGLLWTPISRNGNIQAALNLFAKDNRITILSTPRIMVKSGESADIAVGDEVPVVTSQATRADLPIEDGNSSILQNVTYRKTGVLMQVSATVHSSQRVDLDITQEVSQATTTDSSAISSPTIQSRKASTSLTLADGQSMLLGGLISNNVSVGKSKVPLLGDIPVVGTLFQSRKKQGTRTELIMLITPYIISNEGDARAVTDVVRKRFETGNQKWRAETLPEPLRQPAAQAPANATPPTPVPVLTVPPADPDMPVILPADPAPATENVPQRTVPPVIVRPQGG